GAARRRGGTAVIAWTSPWLVPIALIALLAVARLARVRPAFRPLMAPFALTVLAAIGFAVLGLARVAESEWFALAFLVPLLMLLVRGTVIGFEALFRRRHGSAPPALLDSVVSVVFYGIAL